MLKFNLTELFVYRWRYLIGYSFVILGLIISLIFTGIYLPGGISNQEIQSVIKSSSFNLTDMQSMNLLNFPYYLLQHASIVIFGVSVLSIKLPSIILALLSAIGIIIILRLWYKPNIGILASLVAITTGQFLFIAQNGTTDIMNLFGAICLILITSLIPLQHKFKKILIAIFFIIAALSLYTPFSIYLLLTIGVVTLLHPHLRCIIKRLSKSEIIIGLLVICAAITPLIISIVNSPKLGLTLLGLPETWPNIGNNLILLSNQYLNFSNPGGNTAITPFFELGSMLLILLGIYFTFKNRVTAKSYFIIFWTISLILILILNPNLISISFLPLVLLLAAGINGLLAYWYELFPHNPYARIGGLIPIVILVSALVLSGVNRYIYEYRYDPNIVPNFSKDLHLIPNDTKYLVVDDTEFEFYSVVVKYNKKIILTTSPINNEFLATRLVKKSSLGGYNINKIITTSTKDNANRFYIYKKTAN